MELLKDAVKNLLSLLLEDDAGESEDVVNVEVHLHLAKWREILEVSCIIF